LRIRKVYGIPFMSGVRSARTSLAAFVASYETEAQQPRVSTRPWHPLGVCAFSKIKTRQTPATGGAVCWLMTRRRLEPAFTWRGLASVHSS
jgi:hypothetical protein